MIGGIEMINNVVLVGRTTKDMELKQSNRGSAYVQFILAVNRTFKDENGEQQADFITCVAWNKTAETLSKYVQKGALIGVEGRLQVRSYEKDGSRQWVSEVVINRFTFLESKKGVASEQGMIGGNQQNIGSGNSSYSSHTANYQNPFETATVRAGKGIGCIDDDFPF